MKPRITFFILLLAFISLACSIFVGGPAYTTQVPVSTSDAQNLQTAVATELTAGVETGIVTLTITESQLTSLIAAKLQEQENPPFTDPQVFLRDNQLQLYGKVTRGMFTANISIIATVSVDPTTAAPKIEIVSADFGPFAAPEGLNATINAAVAEAFTGSVGPVATGFRMEAIVITNGVMTITGRVK